MFFFNFVKNNLALISCHSLIKCVLSSVLVIMLDTASLLNTVSGTISIMARMSGNFHISETTYKQSVTSPVEGKKGCRRLVKKMVHEGGGVEECARSDDM